MGVGFDVYHNITIKSQLIPNSRILAIEGGKSTAQQTSSLFCRATYPNALNRRMLLAVNYDMIPIHHKGQ